MIKISIISKGQLNLTIHALLQLTAINGREISKDRHKTIKTKAEFWSIDLSYIYSNKSSNMSKTKNEENITLHELFEDLKLSNLST